MNPKMRTTKRIGVGAHSLAHNTYGVKGRVGAPRWGLGILTNKSIIHADLHNPNKKLVGVELEHFWCMDDPWANMDSQDLARPRLGGSHHLPLYSILCA